MYFLMKILTLVIGLLCSNKNAILILFRATSFFILGNQMNNSFQFLVELKIDCKLDAFFKFSFFFLQCRNNLVVNNI